MLFSILFPAAAYFGMYGGYVRLAGKMPERKNEIKRGKFGRPWILPLILLVLLMLLWGFTSWIMISTGLMLQTSNPVDAVMYHRFLLVYGIAMAADLLLYAIGTLLFKPEIIQRA